jgi:DNA modification methylase
VVEVTLYLNDPDVELHLGDCLEVLAGSPAGVADAVVTSPPYLDMRPEYPSPTWPDFIAIFSHLRRITNNGPFALNVGRLWRDKQEQLWWLDLIEAARAAGYELADTIVWAKENANPIQGQIVSNSHEYVFLFGDPERFNPDGVRTEYAPDSIARLRRRWVSSISVKGDGAERNGPKREARRGERHEPDPRGARPTSVFVCPTGREKGNPHPAPMAIDLAEHLVRLCAREGETILDPFAGSGTTAVAARRHGRRSLGIDRDPEYLAIAGWRLAQQTLLLGDAA